MSWQYFEMGQMPYFNNPDSYDNYKTWLYSNAIVFDTEHMLGADLHSSICGYIGFMGDSIFLMGAPGAAESVLGLNGLRAGYMTAAQAAEMNATNAINNGAALTGGGMSLYANSACN